ncbi:MAG: diguanylate cyclase [Pseudomonadota bacterium]
MQTTASALRTQLRLKLALRVTLGSLLFALIAGAAMFWIEFERQHAEAATLQYQLAATVQSSAAVAAYVKNEEIARDVVTGLLSNPMVAAAGIETDVGASVLTIRRVAGSNAHKDATTRYPLKSPVMAEETIGQLVIEQDVDYINARALAAARWQAMVLVLQIGISALLLIVLFDFVVARPLNAVARMVEAAVPGSGTRLQVPRGHADDEIGSLVRSSNNLLATTERTLDDERALRATIEKMEEHYRRIFETTNVGIMVLDQTGRLINSNPALLARIVGVGVDNDAQNSDFITTIFTDPRAVWGLITQASTNQRSASGDCQLRTSDGSARWVHCIVSVVVGSNHQIELIEGVLYDVTERKLEEDRARRHADHDALTGLRNRRGMEVFLDRSLRHAAEDGQVVGVMLIDLDGFKAVNDTHGHSAGDQVLKVVAQRMLARIRRASDMVARHGGDEFVVIVANSGTSTTAIEELANDLVALIGEPIPLEGGLLAKVGASIGIARYPTNGATRQSLMAAADVAMYGAKKAGKNGYAIAGVLQAIEANPTTP